MPGFDKKVERHRDDPRSPKNFTDTRSSDNKHYFIHKAGEQALLFLKL